MRPTHPSLQARQPCSQYAGMSTVWFLSPAFLGLAVSSCRHRAVEVWGGIWSALGLVACVSVVAVSGFDLASPGRTSTGGGYHKANLHVRSALTELGGLVPNSQ